MSNIARILCKSDSIIEFKSKFGTNLMKFKIFAAKAQFIQALDKKVTSRKGRSTQKKRQNNSSTKDHTIALRKINIKPLLRKAD